MNATDNPTTITAQPGTPFLDVEREFDASAEQVFRAYTDPELVAQWLGPRKYELRMDHFDPTTGGGYAYRHIGDDGDEQAFRGVFHTVDPNRIIVQTFEWAGAPDEVAIEWVTFTETDGRTLVRGRSVFPSIESLEGAMSGGMEWGMRESYDRLAELLAR